MRKFFIAVMTLMIFLTCGCDNNPPTENKNTTVETEKQNSEKKSPADKTSEQKNKKEKLETELPKTKVLEINVYYPDKSGLKLVAVKKEIRFNNPNEKYFAAVKSLIDKPSNKELTSVMPSHTKINSVTVKDGTAFVDFGDTIIHNFIGGSTGEEFLVNSVVNTLTDFKEVKQVRFLIDGKEIETIAGHMDLSVPIKRN